MTVEHLKQKLGTLVHNTGQEELAKIIGCPSSNICDFLAGRRLPTKKILDYFKLKKVITFEYK